MAAAARRLAFPGEADQIPGVTSPARQLTWNRARFHPSQLRTRIAMKKLFALVLACAVSLPAFAQSSGSEVRRASRDPGFREATRDHRVRGDRDRRTGRGDRRHHAPRYHAPRHVYAPSYNYYGHTPRSYYPPSYFGYDTWGTGPRYTVGYGRPYGYGRRGGYYYGASYPVRGGDATTAGTLLGAGLGAIIGHNDGRHGVEGALIGGLLGALIGSAVDEANDRPAQRRTIAPRSASVYDERPAYGFATSAVNYGSPSASASVRYSAPVPEQREFRRPAIAVSRASFTSR